jgi:hypothetical protein
MPISSVIPKDYQVRSLCTLCPPCFGRISIHAALFLTALFLEWLLHCTVEPLAVGNQHRLLIASVDQHPEVRVHFSYPTLLARGSGPSSLCIGTLLDCWEAGKAR